MDIEIPAKFNDLLKIDRKLHGAVELSLEEFGPWLGSSGMPFFPEFTEHGPKHINDTLATASAIVRDGAWNVISAPDVAVLVLAVLLHDSAMHISEDGFVSLVRTSTDRKTIDGFVDVEWHALWIDFLGEASRFDSRRLLGIFGETEPAHNPGFDPRNWTSRDKLLIGEFLRRNHARLAHEIALWGVPGPTTKPLGLKSVPTDIADLSGLVARSHGQPIRSCLGYLKKYDIRNYKQVHAVFLMSVVRIADYLQVQAERAPQQMLQVRQLRSPISQGEWRGHAAVRDIRNTHDDPEAIFVDAEPKDVKTYLRLRRLLASKTRIESSKDTL